MDVGYQYTPYIWPMLASAAWLLALAVYGWRNRTTPGASPFALTMALAALVAIGNAAELAAVAMPAKVNWYVVQNSAMLASAVASLCFALECAGWQPWITRHAVSLSLTHGITSLFLYWLNHNSALLTSRLWLQGTVRADFGPAGLLLAIYGVAVLALTTAVFLVLFVRSPLHRWPVAVILLGQALVRVALLLQINNVLVTPVSLSILGADVGGLTYAFALFGFRFFQVVPVGRHTVIEHMSEGMLVLDASSRIADLNQAAADMLSLERGAAIGRPAKQVLAAHPDLSRLLDQPTATSTEITFDGAARQRFYEAHASPLRHSSGFYLGQLILLQDVTERRLAQSQILQQQRTLATLRERERLAGELHDNLSQSLSFLNMQAQATQLHLSAGQSEATQAALARLGEISRQLHSETRAMINDLLTGAVPSEELCSALRQIVARFGQQTGLAVHLDITGPAEERCCTGLLPPDVDMQLIRVVQEALANVHKHAGCPSLIDIRLSIEAGQLRLSIIDNGAGFDTGAAGADGEHFGLRVMRQRVESVGARLTLQSAPGQGTRVEVHLPLPPEQRECSGTTDGGLFMIGDTNA
jgi:PAS domain S-box-containing protein